jgi:hypothetical protein
MGKVIAFPSASAAPGASGAADPTKLQRLQLYVQYHTLQAAVWTVCLNAELMTAGFPPLQVDTSLVAVIRQQVEELAHSLMTAPATSIEHLKLKKLIEAGTMDIGWDPVWHQQLQRDIEEFQGRQS